MTASARPKLRDSTTRDMLIAATSQIMVEEGYAAATSRRVAAQAGVKPALVHYYFPRWTSCIWRCSGSALPSIWTGNRKRWPPTVRCTRSGTPSSRPKTPGCCWSSWALPTTGNPSGNRGVVRALARTTDHRTELHRPRARHRHRRIPACRTGGRDRRDRPHADTRTRARHPGGHDEAVALVHRMLDRFEMPQPKTRRVAQSG